MARTTYFNVRVLAVVAALALAACLLALVVRVEPSQAAFPGQNGKIAFASDRDGGFEIYTMNADGSKQMNRSQDFGFEGDPSWSPDGGRIAYSTSRDGGTEVYRMRSDGSAQKRLTDNGVPTDSGPVFSPDGRQIAFQSNRDGNFEIYKMRTDGKGPVNLTNDPAGDFTPDWQPLEKRR
jgi:Tol biopolymer transport system component